MTEKPKRRWCQFSLQTLLFLVLLVSLPVSSVSWFAVRMDRASRQ